MSMNSAHNRLKRAEKDFRICWEETRRLWQDEAALKYGKEVIEPLLDRARAAHDAMVHLETALTMLRHDCE